jgi:predicted nucleotidyltransferase
MKMLFKTKTGSHLYGTNTPSSDEDYKGVYMETLDNILLGKDRETIHHNTKKDTTPGVRNSAGDIDIEHKELRRFIKDCLSGQTYALDMLFAPQNQWIESTPTWEALIINRDKLLSKHVDPYIGYCRQQAGKYGLKGSRLGELLRVIEYLKAFDPKKPLYTAVVGLPFSEFVKMTSIETKRALTGEIIIEEFLQVLTKKFQLNRHIDDVLEALEKMNQIYGDRARLAQENQGVDWKAIHHAYRRMYQLRELAQTGKIVFPLADVDYLMKIKKGEISYDIIQDELPLLMDSVIAEVKASTQLPDEPDYAFWDNFIVQVYKNNL